MTPGTPHSALPPQSYADDKRHMSFDSGPQQQQQQQPQQQQQQQSQPPQQPQPPPPPPPQQQPMYGRQPSYPPQTPLPHAQPYEYPPPSYGAQHDGLSYSIHVASSNAKRKGQRASQACETCRQLKAKCDELKPCKSCREKKVECKYRELVPKQQDKVQADILEQLMIMRNDFQDWIATNDRRVGRLEEAVKRIAPAADLQQFEPIQEEEIRPASAESGSAPVAEEAYTSSPTGGAQAPPIDAEAARQITREMEVEKEVEPGPFVQPGVPTIPPNHTTLAAFLLKWRPIEALVRRYLDAEKIKYVDEFPIRQEERRGLLRVWGRGEGMDSSRDRDAPHDLGMMEVHDDYSDAGAPSPADCWGGISGSPGPMDGKSGNGLLHIPDFSESTVWKYVKSFNDNIQNMHPLIIPNELNAMVKLFLDGLHPSSRSKGGGSNIAKFAVGSQGETSLKRKRTSPGPEGGSSEPSLPPKVGRPMFQRSINNALVLLVLALGKICLHKDKRLPDVVPVSEPVQHGSPFLRNGNPAPASPSQGSPPSCASHSHAAGLPSPKDSGERAGTSRRSSFQGSGVSAKPVASLKRNLDVIPGLDYFAHATDILGGQLAGTSLRHIHAYILAGLYHGQLGRVVESYAYIKEAGWALQIKMRPSLDRFKRLQESQTTNRDSVTEKSDNQLVFAFWTCLQLESDIIAELPLPQSHILAFEEIMPYPNINMATGLGFDEHVLRSYLAQLYLRKNLNQIHQTLYNPENPQPLETHSAGGGIIEIIQNSLDMRFVPPEFKFLESDPPAKDILSARLRAKYWGARVITFRPFIRQILEHNFDKAMSTTSPMQGVSPAGRIQDDFSDDVKAYAQKGIKALVESTRAFHGVEDKRFIITNVFGTAHAQWGNLLTLAAVFKDPVLNQYIDEGLLKELFTKTISFFKIISHPSSALSIDMRILEGLQNELWRRPNSIDLVDHQPGSSFSSNASNGIPLSCMAPTTPLPGIHAPSTPVDAFRPPPPGQLHGPLLPPVLGAVPDGLPVMSPGSLPPMQHPPPPY